MTAETDDLAPDEVFMEMLGRWKEFRERHGRNPMPTEAGDVSRWLRGNRKAAIRWMDGYDTPSNRAHAWSRALQEAMDEVHEGWELVTPEQDAEDQFLARREQWREFLLEHGRHPRSGEPSGKWLASCRNSYRRWAAGLSTTSTMRWSDRKTALMNEIDPEWHLGTRVQRNTAVHQAQEDRFRIKAAEWAAYRRRYGRNPERADSIQLHRWLTSCRTASRRWMSGRDDVEWDRGRQEVMDKIDPTWDDPVFVSEVPSSTDDMPRGHVRFMSMLRRWSSFRKKHGRNPAHGEGDLADWLLECRQASVKWSTGRGIIVRPWSDAMQNAMEKVDPMWMGPRRPHPLQECRAPQLGIDDRMLRHG